MIPKIVHQFWSNGLPLPKSHGTYAESWREKNPEWQYVRWNEETMFPMYNQEKYVWSLDSPERTNEFRSALARFEILHRYGGVWFDPEMECINPLNLDLSLKGFAVDDTASVIGAEANSEFLWGTVVRLKQDQHILSNDSLAAWHMHHAVSLHKEVVKMPVCKFFPHDMNGRVRCDLSQALTTYHW